MCVCANMILRCIFFVLPSCLNMSLMPLPSLPPTHALQHTDTHDRNSYTKTATCLDQLVPTFRLFLDNQAAYSSHLHTMTAHTARLMNRRALYLEQLSAAEQSAAFQFFQLAVVVLFGRNMFSMLFKAKRKCLPLCSFVSLPHFLLLHPLFLSSQSFYPSPLKTPEPYGVIFPHPSAFYRLPMQAFTPCNPAQTQQEPVDLSVSKRSSSTSSTSPASSPASSPSSPSSTYSPTRRASPCSPHSHLRNSPAHSLPPPAHTMPYAPMVIQSQGVMVSPLMLPLPLMYPSPIHLHPQIIVSPQVPSDEGHPPSREHKRGETCLYLNLFTYHFTNT